MDDRVGKQTVVKAGKAGIFCKPCDMAFKDSLQYLDHCRTPSHLQATGQIKVKAATLGQVRERIEHLAAEKGAPKYDREQVHAEARKLIAKK